MKLLDITYLQYTGLSEDHKREYDFALKNGKNISQGKDVYNIGDLKLQTFGVVKSLQMFFASDSQNWTDFLKLLAEMIGKELEEAAGFSIFKLSQQMYYIKNQVAEVNEMEQNNLSGESSSLEKAAGSNRFDKFGVMLQVDSLAGGDALKYKEVNELQYNTAFSKLLLEKERADFQKDYNRLVQQQQKRARTWG